MQTLQRSPGHGLRIAGERATVRADIVISYSIAEGHWEELERREGVAMTLGEGVDPLSLLVEDVLAIMKEGEVCNLSPVPRELAGDLPVPSAAVIRLTLSLHSFQRAKPVWEMEASELVYLARQYKDRGTQLYEEQREKAAAVCYSRAAKLAVAATAEEDLQLALFLNLAACQLRLGHSSHAFENCSRVLAARPDSAKALYRRAMAAMKMGDLEQADKDLCEARRVEPGNTAIQRRLKELQSLRQSYQNRLSEVLKPMFTSSP